MLTEGVGADEEAVRRSEVYECVRAAERELVARGCSIASVCSGDRPKSRQIRTLSLSRIYKYKFTQRRQARTVLTASHFMEFSGVTWPNSRTVTAESVGLLKRFESDAVPQNFLPCFLNAALSPVAAGAGEPPAGVVGGGWGADVVGAGAPADGWHCE